MGYKKAKASKDKKTNVMRLLDQADIIYTSHNYESTGAISGTEVAAVLGQDPDRTFKTLVTHGRQEHYVFIVPVAALAPVNDTPLYFIVLL
jgi:Cys-tRNA(Pro)/Cys-tRNA(Cys) deacylase